MFKTASAAVGHISNVFGAIGGVVAAVTWIATYTNSWSWAAIWLSTLGAGLGTILVLSLGVLAWGTISGKESTQPTLGYSQFSRFRGVPMLPMTGMATGFGLGAVMAYFIPPPSTAALMLVLAIVVGTWARTLYVARHS